jgi:Asp-tRNA(Asn)/Glu-tRNA(Gln) amidotransferase A subunit family amidase
MPAGRAESGAPLGVQLVAAWGHDAKLLAAAAAYEAATSRRAQGAEGETERPSYV